MDLYDGWHVMSSSFSQSVLQFDGSFVMWSCSLALLHSGVDKNKGTGKGTHTGMVDSICPM